MLAKHLQNVGPMYEEWWKGTNKNPLIFCAYFDKSAFDEKAAKIKKDWMPDDPDWVLASAFERAFAEGDLKYIGEAMDVMEIYFQCEEYYGAGFPSYFTNLGPGCLAAFITNFAKFTGETVWFELDKPMDWEDINSLAKKVSRYYQTAVETVRIVASRLKDHAVVSMLDLGGVVDILASLRRTEVLLYDVVDYPEEMNKAIDSIQVLWKKVHDELFEILDKYNNGYHTTWMSLLSSRAQYPSQCDFSAMISPAMFEELVLPSLKKEMSWFEKGIYHLDGPGELPHLDLLLSIENLHAIQWVPMPGQPHYLEMHYPLYGKIIENGRKIILNGFIDDIDQMKKLFSVLPGESFFLTVSAKNRQQAEKIASLAAGR